MAEVDGRLWDMHYPLQNAKTVRFLHMKEEDPQQASLANKVFWRSCSYLLGAIIENSFNEDVPVQLHSFPSANGMFSLELEIKQCSYYTFFHLFFASSKRELYLRCLSWSERLET